MSRAIEGRLQPDRDLRIVDLVCFWRSQLEVNTMVNSGSERGVVWCGVVTMAVDCSLRQEIYSQLAQYRTSALNSQRLTSDTSPNTASPSELLSMEAARAVGSFS